MKSITREKYYGILGRLNDMAELTKINPTYRVSSVDAQFASLKSSRLVMAKVDESHHAGA
jgi:hypothetical protein